LAKPLRLKREGDQPAPPVQLAKPARKSSANAYIAMGLWALLWSGYNTGPEYAMEPNFPSNASNLIHGVRAFFPMLAGWFAIMLMFVRSSRLFSWLVGPLGLLLMYAVVGLIPTALFLTDPGSGLYYGVNYLALTLVLLAIVLVDDPLPDLRKVLTFTWMIGAILTIGLLGAIPVLGSESITEMRISPVGIRAYSGHGTILGMASSRNTGVARYAAISALVALPGLMRKGKISVRVIWGILFVASVYGLVVANGRTEIAGFIGGVVVILSAEKARRFIYFLAAGAAAFILGLRGFYSAFYLYFTRTGTLDLSMTGRTGTWDEGWRVLATSPWVGLGFQADRYYLHTHMHNAFLHVLFQAGFLGGGAILVGLAIVWFYLIKYFFVRQPADKSLIPAEIPAVFLFTTISSLTESTFAYFSAAWLLTAPIAAYVMALHRHLRRMAAKTALERIQRARSVQRGNRSSGAVVPPSVV
jgi:hypothetical protein